MKPKLWTQHVTVATIVDAVIHETLEETTHPFEPQALVSVYQTHFEQSAKGGATYP